MVAEADRAGRIVERLKPWWIRALAAAILSPALFTGVLGILYLGQVISGCPAEATAITMIRVAHMGHATEVHCL